MYEAPTVLQVEGYFFKMFTTVRSTWWYFFLTAEGSVSQKG